jgi:hypothetical protein
MNNANAEQVTQLPSTQKDSYHSIGIDNVSLSSGTESVPQNAVAHHFGVKRSTHLLSSKLLL